MNVVLACHECHNRNYKIQTQNNLQRLRLKKYCPICRKATIHEQTK